MKNKGMVFAIIILILLVLGLSGFIVYDKVINKEKPEHNVKITEETKAIEENLDETAQMLIDKLEKYYVDYYDKDEKMDFASADDKDLIKGAYAYKQDDTLTKEKVDDYYNNLFGKKLTNYPDFNCWANDGILYKYNYDKNEYEREGLHGHGGLCTSKSSFIKYNNIEKNEDTYTITVTKVYEPADGMCQSSEENAFYADYKYTVKIDELSSFTKTDAYGNIDKADIIGAKDYYNQNYDKFKNIKPQYKYTFKKSNDNYYLVSYETIK